MRVVIDVDGVRRETEVLRAAETVTLADLVGQVCDRGVASDDTVWVDQSKHTAGQLLSEVTLMDGAVIGREPIAVTAPVTGWSVTRSGGLQAGQVLAVPARRPLTIGRSPQADITLDSGSASWSHLTVEHEGTEIRVRDTDSTNGTFVNGLKIDADGVLVDTEAVIVAGGAALLLRRELPESPAPRPGSLRNITPAGTVPFNRPPRPGRLPGPEPVALPVRKEVAPASKFSIITTFAPLLLAAAMIVTMHNLAYAGVAALTPLIGVVTWWDQKRRRDKESAGEDSRYAGNLGSFHAELRGAADAERARRQDESPDPATSARRALLPATTLWQRRASSGDFLSLHAGVGDVPWTPPIDRAGASEISEEVQQVLDEARILAAPVQVDLTGAGVVGVVGDRDTALAVARSLLVQASVHVGPADLTIAVLCDPGREGAWDWTVWLPHTRRLGQPGSDAWISAERARSEALLRALRDGIEEHPTPAVLLVLDTEVLLEGRDSVARALLGHGRPSTGAAPATPPVQISGIVIAAAEEQLPAACTVVIHAGHDADGSVTRPGDRAHVDDVILAGLEPATARTTALALARFEDPELAVPGAAIPATVRLNPLLGLNTVDTAAVIRHWQTSTGTGTPVGVSEHGVYRLDLVADGPHGLVGGTTGSGKSEFLRSLVAGLAANNPPSKLTFILIDFKGGAAFATCERLPHTIGTVSNLDEQLADRALRALEAEMDYRQRVFADAGEGIDNLDAYLATNPAEPMPRLLLVIDEFAMLAKDYPDVLTSLVSVAAVGRTLGVHMILATQRPAGVVNDDILANTNLRVALRVQSREDSSNVIGVPDAAAIARGQQGRAFIKLGQTDITPVQTAWSTGPLTDEDPDPLEVRPVLFGPAPAAPRTSPKRAATKQTELDLLIDTIVAASHEAGYAPPRPVWPEPLGERVALTGFTHAAAHAGPVTIPVIGAVSEAGVVIGLADDPDRQRQIPAAWDMRRGNLLLAGIPGSGTSTTLATIALTLSRTTSPDELDLLILDMGSRDLAPLADLPHSIGYAASGSAAREQQARLLKYLRSELDRRKTDPRPHRTLLVLVDGLAALRDEYQDFEGADLLDSFYRVYADGPDVGVHIAITTSRIKAIPAAIDEVTTQKWLYQLADRYDYSTYALTPTQLPANVPGRCVPIDTKLQTRIATPETTITDAVRQVAAEWGHPEAKTSVVRQLPETVTAPELVAAGARADLGGEPWLIPVGLRESDLEPGYLELYEGEHLLIAGPGRSGKSNLLLALGELLRAADRELQVWGISGRRSPLASSSLLDRVMVGADDLAAVTAAARVHRSRLLLLVDDAEQFDDADQGITGMLEANNPALHVFAAGRSDDLRSLYGHWTTRIRKARAGVLLQPNTDYDGELLGLNLPRTSPVALTAGRGYACLSGVATLVQTPTPSTW